MLSRGDELWRRHANPWSVYTRFAAIPAMIVAVWSRAWIGPLALIPVAAVVLWLVINPTVFPPVTTPDGWAARGIYGERMWLMERSLVPRTDRLALRRLITLGVAGLLVIAWGLVRLLVWPTVLGAALLVVAQLWRLDRMGRVYEAAGRGFEDRK